MAAGLFEAQQIGRHRFEAQRAVLTMQQSFEPYGLAPRLLCCALIGLAVYLFMFAYGQVRDYLPAAGELAEHRLSRSPLGARVQNIDWLDAEFARGDAVTRMSMHEEKRPSASRAEPLRLAAKPIKKNHHVVQVVQRHQQRPIDAYAWAPSGPWMVPPPRFGGY